MPSTEKTNNDHITNPLAVYCTLYLTIAAEWGGGKIVSPKHIELINDYLTDRAWWASGAGEKQQKLMENGKLTEEALEKLVEIATDYEQQARLETTELREALLNTGGTKAVIENYNFLVRLLGSYKGKDPEYKKDIVKLHQELTQIAMAEGEANITSSQKVLLDKTAEAWKL
tara:strand:- start:304 stop:819 length:516 start_codon:yes stop_codon:yes gene_type:complete